MGSRTRDAASFTSTAAKAPIVAAVAAFIGVSGVSLSAPVGAQEASSSAAGPLDEIRVTARRREESAQEVPIPISVLSGDLVADTGSFNVNRVKELVPAVQMYSSNPRNTGVNIRGLGSPFGLTNDGIEPGVGFYVDGVLYARPAATTLDFIDVQQVEVLRGPQGTLFGKNTTAGAILVTTRKPSRDPGVGFELGYGNDGFLQTKGSVTGPLGEKFAGRLSLSATQRDGNVYNVATQKWVNDLDNTGLRGQLLFSPSDRVDITAALDFTRQRPEGYAQVFAGVAPTLRPANRQFEQIVDDLGYEPPSRNPFDRLIDHDTPWRSGNEMGGVSLNADIDVGPGTLTSTTAWRFWDWDPSNDRDYLGLPVGTLSQAPSKHDQVTQEIRWAGDVASKLSGVFGFFAFDQKLNTDPVHTEQAGAAAYRFLVAPGTPGATPELYDGYGSAITSELNTFSAALFGQIDWAITDRLHLMPGIRFNYDEKEVDFNREVYGGPASPTPQQQSLLLAVYRPQAFATNVDDTNTSGQLTLSFQANDEVNAYATYATSFKSVGLNLGGLPLDNANQTILSAAEIAPEDVSHIEIGVKTSPTPRSTANVTLFNTEIEDFQTQVFNSQIGVARGYLANADTVRVRGVELDGSIDVGDSLTLHGAIAYSDGEYVSFPDAPPPIEETGGPQSKDISGGRLPGLSEWAASFGGEHAANVNLFGTTGELFTGFDVYYRDDFSSSPSPSQYLNVDAYSLLNFRVGFRASNGWSGYVWARNALDEEYFEQLLAAPAGNGAGHYGAVLGEARTYGVTVRYSFD
jgi:iron complex outermembrane recepter protein